MWWPTSGQADGGWAMRELRNQGEVDIPCLGLTLTLEQMYGRLVAADSE